MSSTQQHFPTPSFRLIHCKVEIPCDLFSINRDAGENIEGLSPFINSPYNLTRLEIIPGPLDNPAGSTAGPWVIAVLSSPLHATPDHPGQLGSSNVVVRWQLDTAAQTLHPKFDEVVLKKNNAAQTKV